jgi:hypothetical protein
MSCVSRSTGTPSARRKPDTASAPLTWRPPGRACVYPKDTVYRHVEVIEMATLFSIGRFAERTCSTHKALRLYDELGLLRPALTAVRLASATTLRSNARSRAGSNSCAVELPLRTLQALADAHDASQAQALLAQHHAAACH